MIGIKKSIFKTRTLKNLPPPPEATITEISESDQLCYKIVEIKVDVSVPVKVNMVGTFGIGGSYYLEAGYRSSDIVDEVISTSTTYKFGINASRGGTLIYFSNINFIVNDFTTGDQITTYTLNRDHEADSC